MTNVLAMTFVSAVLLSSSSAFAAVAAKTELPSASGHFQLATKLTDQAFKANPKRVGLPTETGADAPRLMAQPAGKSIRR